MGDSDYYEFEIDSWDRFTKFAGRKPYRGWIYRGQCDSKWTLVSSYQRYCKELDHITTNAKFRYSHEKMMVKSFKEHISMYTSQVPPENILECLSFMQHHGTPTRLLDWSFSPYVAAYFAVRCGFGDFSIYCMNHKALSKIYKNHFGDKFENMKKKVLAQRDKSFLFAYEPEYKHKRLVAQQGVFTVPSSNYMSIDELMHEGVDIPQRHFKKLIIPSCKRVEWIKNLMYMNINEATLFPDFDGFCRSLQSNLIYTPKVLKRIC